jgi:hypothetical protein
MRKTARSVLLCVAGLAGVWASTAQAVTDEIAKKTFDEVLKRCVLAYKIDEAERINKPEEQVFVKVKSSPAKIEYDITRTQSLVSPFSASLTVARTAYSTIRYATIDEAQGAKDLDPRILFEYTYSFAYQGDQWVMKELASKVTFLKDGAPEGRSSRMVIKPTLRKDGTPPPELVCANG